MYSLAQATEKEKLPVVVNEPNQAEIDAKQAEILSESTKERRDQRKQFVVVVADGPVYRWRRQVGPGTAYTSRESFRNRVDAIEAAIIVAHCYSVPALVPGKVRVTNSRIDGQAMADRPRCYVCTWANPLGGRHELLTAAEQQEYRRKGYIVTESRL